MSNKTSSYVLALPSGWESRPLAEIARINPPIDRCVSGDNVEVNFVPMRAVEPEGGGLARPEKRAYCEVKKGYTSFLSGDVIMAKITPCMENGKTSVVPELPGTICFGSTEFHVVRPEDGVAPRWIANFLLQHEVRRAAQRAMTGAVGQMRVPGSFLETVCIPVAPSDEQRRITDELDELLSDLDAGVAALERVRAKLAQYRASVLKAAVEGTLTAEWRQRHPHTDPATELLKRILAERRRRWEEEQLQTFKEKRQEPAKDWKAKYKEPITPETANIPPLPKGWCWATCNQLAWTSRYGTSVKCRETTDGLAVLRIPNIIGGNLDLRNLKYAPGGYTEAERELVGIGDLLVVRTNGSRKLIGRGAVVRDAPTVPVSFASYLIRLRLVSVLPILDWLAILWESFHVRRWVEAHAATSAGQYNISLGVLESLVIPIPPVAEQEAIAEAVEGQLSVVDHLDADVNAKLKSARGLRQAILRHAFRGQLVPQVRNEAPASELLKHIAAEREQQARQAAPAKRGAQQLPKLRTARKPRATKNATSGDH